MVKELLTLLLSCFVLVGAQPYNPKLSLATSVKNEVTAGTEFLVTIQIDKGTLSEYSRFSQELPYGLSAVNISSPNADFTFENQRVRVIWLKLPEEKEITVEYKIKVHERLKGKFTLGGEFAYIINNERSFVQINPQVDLMITPKPGLDPSLIVDISDFKDKVTPEEAETVSKDYAMAIRQEPELLPNGEVLIHLLVRNPKGSTYMKVEEALPKGYMFEEVNSEGAIVSYAASQVRFIWMKQPASDPLMITYKLVPKAGETQDPVKLSGSYSYSASGKSETVPFKELAVNLNALSKAQQLSLMQQGDFFQAMENGQTPAVQGNEAVKSPDGSSTGKQQGQGTTGQGTTGTQTDQKTTENRTEQKTNGNQMEQKTGENRIEEKTTPTTVYGEGVEYRVQIGAFRDKISTSHYSRKGVKANITETREEGLYKYTVGPFSTYDQALAARKSLIRDNHIPDAFVVAYSAGKRIPVRSTLK